MDELFGTLFGSTVVSQQLAYLEASLLKDIWETFYSTVLSTFFAYVIGLPLGIILVTGEPDGVRPLPRALMRVINVIVNLLRSVPFLILMVLVIPLSRVIIGTSTSGGTESTPCASGPVRPGYGSWQNAVRVLSDPSLITLSEPMTASPPVPSSTCPDRRPRPTTSSSPTPPARRSQLPPRSRRVPCTIVPLLS